MVDAVFLRILLAALVGWRDSRQQEALAYLIEENRILRSQLHGRRVRLSDDDRCRLAVRGHRLGRRGLRQVATIVTPDTILRWHRQLIARKCWTTGCTISRTSPRSRKPAADSMSTLAYR